MVEKASVVNGVSSIYESEAYYLKNTAAAKAVATYLAIETKERSDLITLRASLNTYKDSISNDNSVLNPLTLYSSVNKLLQVIGAEIVGDAALTGFTLLGVGTRAQDSITEELSSINGALETAVGKNVLTDVNLLGVVTKAATSLSGEITSVNRALETAVGKNTLTDVTLLGVVTKAATSLSGEVISVNGALETAVGKNALTDVTLLGVVTKAATSLSGEVISVNGALETAVGKNALTDMTFLKVVTKAATSLSGQVSNVITAVGVALTSLNDRVTALEKKSDIKIGPETAVTVTGCVKSGKNYVVDEKPIYTTSNDFAQAMVNGFKCNTFVSSGSKKDLYITITGKSEGCGSLLSGNDVYSSCIKYQDANWADA